MKEWNAAQKAGWSIRKIQSAKDKVLTTTSHFWRLSFEQPLVFQDCVNDDSLPVFYHLQILYALRTLADIDLNYYGTPTSTVRKMYKQYLWEDNSHQIKKDIIRLQSLPGFATSYMIGQIKISEMKALAKKELAEDFSLKDFHYEVLREGEFPLDNLEEHMKYYIACKKNPQDVGCEEFL